MPEGEGGNVAIIESGLMIVAEPEITDKLYVVAKRLSSADRIAAVALLTIRFGPGAATGRPGLSAVPLAVIAVSGAIRGLMKFASVSGAEDFQKSSYTISASGMVPRSNTCDLMRSA